MLIFVVCGGVNFLFAFEGVLTGEFVSIPQLFLTICLREDHKFLLVKTGVRVLHIKLELACF